MRAYKMEVLVIDNDNVGLQVKNIIENGQFPNDCIRPQVMKLQIADIGEWSDDHPLNKHETAADYYEKIFSEESQ